MNRTLTVGAAVAAAITLAACGNSTPAAGTSPKATSTSTSMSMPMSATAPAATEHNQADVMFAQMMIPHHQQAIEMSDMILGKQGIAAQVRDLATRIKAAQGPEIEQMKGWLSQWGVPGMGTPGTNMPGMGTPGTGMPDMPMPGMHGGDGMMSQQDMAALQNAQGVAASKLFLTQMIAHHQGAISMADTEIATGKFPDAVALANTIKTSQRAEIDTMKTLLGTL